MQMTYEKIYDLKFNKNVTTFDLEKQFPNERDKISRIALLELSPTELRRVMRRSDEFQKIMNLKQWLERKNTSGKVKQEAV
jgi:hypothetical protein